MNFVWHWVRIPWWFRWPARIFCAWNFPGKKYWSGLPFPSPRDLPNPGIKPASLVSSALEAYSLPLHHLGSPSWLAAKSLQLCPTLCNPIDGSPPGSNVPGILQARTLEWLAISFSNTWKWKVKVKSLSHVQPSATPWTAALPQYTKVKSKELKIYI